MGPRTLARVLSVVWGIVIGVLMLLPRDAFPESELLSYDKLAHLAVFAGLSFLLCAGWFVQKNNKAMTYYLAPLTICVVYGSLLEYLQQFVPGRMFDLYDFVANFTGGLVGVIIFSIFIRQKFVIDKLML